MESQPQNPEFRINPENVHPCCSSVNAYIILSVFMCILPHIRDRDSITFISTPIFRRED